jgi:hypothetical protein
MGAYHPHPEAWKRVIAARRDVRAARGPATSLGSGYPLDGPCDVLLTSIGGVRLVAASARSPEMLYIG